MPTKRRSGTVLLLVICILFGCSVIVFAAARLAVDGAAQGAARYRKSAANLAARGGVHVAVSNLARFEPQPARILRDTKLIDSFHTHRNDAPVGFFVAKTGFPPPTAPTDTTIFRIESEQARMPLSALTTAAVRLLFPDTTRQQRFKDVIARRKFRPATGGGPVSVQTDIFKHPYELLTIGAATREELFGQDFNDNAVLEDFENERNNSRVFGTLGTAGAVDRGMLDLVTTFTDNRFDPYEADDKLRTKFLEDFGGAIKTKIDGAKTGRPPPNLLAPDDAVWTNYARANLTNVSTFFRIKSFGTLKGETIARAEAVVEFVPGDPKKDKESFYRIAYWRVDL